MGFFSSNKRGLTWSPFSTRLGVRSSVVLMSSSGCLVQIIVTIHNVTNRKNKTAEISIAVAKSRPDMIVNLAYSKGSVVTLAIGAVAKSIHDYVTWLHPMANWIIFVRYLFSLILFSCRNAEKMITIFSYNEKFSNTTFKSYFRENYQHHHPRVMRLVTSMKYCYVMSTGQWSWTSPSRFEFSFIVL